MSAEDEDEALAELDRMIADADKVAEMPEEELEPQLPDVPSDKIPGETWHFESISRVALFENCHKIRNIEELDINSKRHPIQTLHLKVLSLQTYA